ncbi:Uncharacterised protein [Mycobacteroides abscessus subsp. abscessus]|nr:Uncharacterised protein [Mycobacteroides abscessus]SIN56039.1 Uncharacterised protein [Mycobacteroides abscessus subsp. abscessus]SKX19780.1 Uncharacterised protein [Mycobacteroides abscessus subsp. abscessus]
MAYLTLPFAPNAPLRADTPYCAATRHRFATEDGVSAPREAVSYRMAPGLYTAASGYSAASASTSATTRST